MLRTLLEKAKAINDSYAQGKINYLKYKALKAQVLDDVEASIYPVVSNYFIV